MSVIVKKKFASAIGKVEDMSLYVAKSGNRP